MCNDEGPYIGNRFKCIVCDLWLTWDDAGKSYGLIFGECIAAEKDSAKDFDMRTISGARVTICWMCMEKLNSDQAAELAFDWLAENDYDECESEEDSEDDEDSDIPPHLREELENED